MRHDPPRAGEEPAVGRLLGIARHARRRGPIEVVEQVAVTRAEGVHGDYRGALKPGGRNRRQVTVMTTTGWRAAMTDLALDLDWHHRRVNLLVEGIELVETTGARLVFAGGVVLDITGECDPCSRMEEIAPGLKAALLPGWRGGVTTRVAGEGVLAIDDEVRIERA